MGLVEDITRELVNDVSKDRAWRHALSAVLADMSSGYYPRSYLDLVVQKQDNTYTLYDAFCFATIDYLIKTGQIAITAIDAGEPPFPDSEVGQMNEVLSRLPSHFTGKFLPRAGAGGPHDDGDFYWSKPIHAVVLSRPNQADFTLIRPRPEGETVGPCFEVGTQSSEKTLWWLTGFDGVGGLARWPYGSRYIYLLNTEDQFIYNTDPEFEQALRDTADTPMLAVRAWDILNTGFETRDDDAVVLDEITLWGKQYIDSVDITSPSPGSGADCDCTGFDSFWDCIEAQSRAIKESMRHATD